MPTLSGHFDEELGGLILAAIKDDPKPHGAISRWIVEAARQRLEREGRLPSNPKAELFAAIEKLGLQRALEALRAAQKEAG